MEAQLEMKFEIWHDNMSPDHIEVGSDADGLGMIDIVMLDSDNKQIDSIRLLPEVAAKVAVAITRILSEEDKKI